MPYLTKEALSQYLRTGCQRQLRLNLSPDNARYRPERLAQGMPDPQPPRPGLPLIKQAGDAWAAAKVGDLATTFGTAAVIGIPQTNLAGITIYKTQDLTQLLAGAVAGQFLVEAQYEITAAFEQALGIASHATTLNLRYGEVRPDLIEVCAPGSFTDQVLPNGEIQMLPSGDTRLQLRLIDIKLTSEPSPSYYAEVTYYTVIASCRSRARHRTLGLQDDTSAPRRTHERRFDCNDLRACGRNDEGLGPSEPWPGRPE